MIRSIVYDVGYVLVGYSWAEHFRRMGYDEEGVGTLAGKLFGSGKKNEDDRTYWAHYDMGDVTDEEARDHFLRTYPEDRAALEWYFDHMADWCVYLRDLADTIPVMKRKGYGIYLLSNYPDRIWKCHIGQAPFAADVDGAVVSYQERMGKPDERFYRVLLERYHLRAEECLFLDDRKENTEAARKLGFQTITLDTPLRRQEAVNRLMGLPAAAGR